MTTDDLVKIQSKIKVLSDDFNAYYADWKGAKVRFVKLTKMFTSNVAAPTQQEVPQAKKHLLSRLKNMPTPLMKIRLLKKPRVPGLMMTFQLLKELPGQPLVLRLKNKPGQLKHLSLR